MDPRETEIWNEPGISHEAKLLWVCLRANGNVRGSNYATQVFDLIISIFPIPGISETLSQTIAPFLSERRLTFTSIP